ncbi:MAG: LytTR family DNA-binding domain-containing protein [Saprospiraceae bacterium]|nr:LytTR family transcriptional regulator DNA-binding domain-containing protein [Lewinella sp.]
MHSNTKYIRLIITVVLLTAITFETFQQLYYVRRFQLGDDVTFWKLLESQSYKWLIWLLLSGGLVWYAKRQKGDLTLLDLITHGLVIIGLVVLNIFIISTLQLAMNGDSFTWDNLLREYLPFFTFQKAPVYLLGYVAMAVILHLYFTKEQLEVEVQQLAEVEKHQAEQYRRLKDKVDNKTPVLNIKIGNKRRIIPVADINWIEADDYCVRVHTINQDSYTMRSSLKALEDGLKGDFVRVHRKAIVNMARVEALLTAPDYRLLLKDKTVVPVAKSKLKRVRTRLHSTIA